MDKNIHNNLCNEKKFNDFFRDNSSLLNNYIFYKCGNIDLSQDITQDAFIKFWNNCHKIIPQKAKSYLFTIANNLFLNEYSKSKVVSNYKNNLKSS